MPWLTSGFHTHSKDRERDAVGERAVSLSILIHKGILLLAILATCASAASATTISKPFTFSAGTTILSSQVNSNFDTLYTAINGNIDNTNIGAGGIFASQVLCSTLAQCTFQSPQTYSFNPNNTSVVPLLITNAANPSADYLDIGTADGFGVYQVMVGGSGNLFEFRLNSVSASAVPLDITGFDGGAQADDYIDVQASGGFVGGIFRVDQNGNTFLGGDLNLKASTQTPASSAVAIYNDNGSPQNMIFNVPAFTSSYEFGENSVAGTGNKMKLQILSGFTNFVPASSTQLFNVSNAANTVNNFQIADLGTVSAAPFINGVHTLGPLEPTYTTNGNPAGTSTHETSIATLTCVFSASTTCTTGTVTLTGAAVFTGAAFYLCPYTSSTSAAGNPAQVTFNPISGTQFNFSESSVSATSRTDTISYFCHGA